MRATRTGLALRTGVALGVLTGAVTAAGAGTGTAMPYGAVVAPFGAAAAQGAEGAVDGLRETRQETAGGRFGVPARTTAPSSSPAPAPSSDPSPALFPLSLLPLSLRSAAAAVVVPPLPTSVQPSRAGSRAGEGRERPGREASGPEERSEGPDGSEGTGEAGPRDGGPRDGGRGTGDGASPVPDPSRPAGRGSGVPERPGEAFTGVDGTGPVPASGDRTEGSGDSGAGTAHRAPPSQEAAATADSEVSRRPTADTVTGTGRAAGPVLRILPLGSGLVLMGLGLGLAFVGLRLRRS
ncbi:hypothetical protein ACIGW5_08190 [Streptomyces prasinus]|uniref:hypothetical protein n=1 Tax=Streptomyces prasinus TaxID=67345 RepID=UPI0037D0865C